MIFVYLCGKQSNRILIDSSASTIQASLVLRFAILRQFSPQQFAGVLQGIASGIGISNFLPAFFMVCLNSSSSGSMKKIPRICLALSSFGFSTALFLLCFAFRCIRHMLPHVWPYIHCRVLKLFLCSSVSTRTMCIRHVAFRSKR